MVTEPFNVDEVSKLEREVERLGALVDSMSDSPRYQNEPSFREEARKLLKLLHAAREKQTLLVDSILKAENANLVEFTEELGGQIDSLQNKIETAEAVIDVAAGVERIVSLFTPFGILTHLGL